MKSVSAKLSVAMALMGVLLPEIGSAQRYTNPVALPQLRVQCVPEPCVPDPPNVDAIDASEPSVLEFAGDYYMFLSPTYPEDLGTGMGPRDAGIFYVTSKNLVEWGGLARVAFNPYAGTPTPNPCWLRGRLYSPSAKHWRGDGAVYLYYSAGGVDRFPSHCNTTWEPCVGPPAPLVGSVGIGVARGWPGPDGFADVSADKPLVSNAQHPFLYEEPDGSALYLFFHSLDPQYPGICVWPMSDPTTPIGSAPIPLGIEPEYLPASCGVGPGDVYDDQGVREAPSVVKRGDRYFMTLSTRSANTIDYNVIVATSDSADPTEGWTLVPEGYESKRFLFESDGGGGVPWGPGNGEFVTGPDSATPFFMYQEKMSAAECETVEVTDVCTSITSTITRAFDRLRYPTLDPVAFIRESSTEDAWLSSSGGSGGVMPGPMIPMVPFEALNFELAEYTPSYPFLPSRFTGITGSWLLTFGGPSNPLGYLYASQNASLKIVGQTSSGTILPSGYSTPMNSASFDSQTLEFWYRIDNNQPIVSNMQLQVVLRTVASPYKAVGRHDYTFHIYPSAVTNTTSVEIRRTTVGQHGDLGEYLGGGSFPLGAADLKAGSHRFAFVKDGRRYSMSVDGKEVAVGQAQGTILPQSGEMYLNVANCGSNFDGWRQILGRTDDATDPTSLSDQWTVLSGSWTRLTGDPYKAINQSLQTGTRMAITKNSFGAFDTSVQTKLDFDDYILGSSDLGCGLIFNYSSSSNYGYCILRPDGIEIGRRNGSTWVVADVIPAASIPRFNPFEYSRLGIRRDLAPSSTPKFVVTYNGTEIDSQPIPDLQPTGKLGIMTKEWSGTFSSFHCSGW